MGVHHDTFTVTRDLSTDISTAFGLWADSKALGRWYLPGDEGWKSEILHHSFEVGGRKHLSFGPIGEPPFQEDCRYEDIVNDERIIFSMTVANGSTRLTSSLVTVEFSSVDSGTRISMTEQMAILDGADSSEERRQGWGEVFDKLEAEL